MFIYHVNKMLNPYTNTVIIIGLHSFWGHLDAEDLYSQTLKQNLLIGKACTRLIFIYVAMAHNVRQKHGSQK